MNTLRMVTWAEHKAPVGKVENMYDIFAPKPQGRAPVGTSKYRWEVNIELVP
jgi:hypothetical protein